MPERFVSYQVKEQQVEETYYQKHHQQEYKEQISMQDHIAFKASSNPNIMHYHEAMKAPGREQFLQALIQEVNAHIDGDHWELIRSEDVPGDAVILNSVWAMHRKRDIKTRQVYKHKARLNMNGGQQIQVIH